MAQINRHSRRTPYEGSLYQLPIDLIAKTLDYTQKQYDENKDIADQIKDFSIPSLPQDRELANKLQQQYAQQVDDVVKEYSGDYSRASNKLKDLTRKIKKDFNPGGEAHAITSNYTNYNTWLKNSQDLVEKGKALGEDFNLANQYHMKNYSGIGQFDPVKGQYNVFNPETLSEYADMEQNIQKSFSTFKPEKRKEGRTTFENGQIKYHEVETEGISADRLRPSFEQILATDPKVSTYYSQKARYLGLSPAEAQKYISTYAAQRAQDLAYQSSSDTERAQRDPMSLLHERARLADAAKKKEGLENISLWATQPGTTIPYRKESNIDPNDWRKLSPSYSPSEFALPYTLGTSQNSANTKYKDKNLLDVLFTNDFISESYMDPMLSKALWKQMSAKNAKAYVTNYGQNQAWTDQFESDFLKAYKAAEKNHAMVAPVTYDIPSDKARYSVVSRIADRLINPDNVMVIPYGASQAQSASSLGLTQEDLRDAKTNRLKTADVQIAYPGPGLAATGHLINTAKGTFTFVDDNEDRNRYNSPLKTAANNLFFQGKGITDHPISLGSRPDGSDAIFYIERNIGATDSGTEEVLYAIPVSKEGKPDLTVPKYPVHWRDIQNHYVQQGITHLNGTGETKASGTWFNTWNQLGNEDYNTNNNDIYNGGN